MGWMVRSWSQRLLLPAPERPASPRTLLVKVRVELPTMGAYSLRGGCDLRPQKCSMVNEDPSHSLRAWNFSAGPNLCLPSLLPHRYCPYTWRQPLTTTTNEPGRQCLVQSSGLIHFPSKASCSHFKEILSPVSCFTFRFLGQNWENRAKRK